jgi:signal recognition particle subunit SRP54
MFDALAKGFRQAKNRLAGLTELTEQNVDSALREVRLSLLEADVELGVVKGFLARVKEKALGEVVRIRAKTAKGETTTVSAGDQFVKICHDELVACMTSDGPPLTFAEPGSPTGIMMVGLQGSGKTTTTAKLALLLKKQGKKPLLVAADMQRPAAVEQLQILGKQVGVPVFNIPGATPLEICEKAAARAKAEACDVIVYDTAGRLAIDEKLMEELSSIKANVWPENVLLVIDAMIGQDAVKVSKGFHERLGLTGVVATKLDGDARGGAMLSVREVTGAPIRFVGMGEQLDKLEEFRPEGMAQRVLGLGDVVGLMKDFEQVIDEKKAADDAMKMLEGKFTLDDFLDQVRMIQKMGPLKEIVGKMPGMSDLIPSDTEFDDRELVRVEAMISSFTRFERNDPYALVREPTRAARIAKGSGTNEQAVNELVQKFLFMRQMMEGIGNMGMLGKIPGMKNLKMAKNLKKQMAKGGGMPGGMGMPGFGFPGMPGMGMPGMGMPGFPGMMGGEDEASGSLTKMKSLTTAEKNAKKAQRKREKDARRKSRR